jgi:hypothetical protein
VACFAGTFILPIRLSSLAADGLTVFAIFDAEGPWQPHPPAAPGGNGVDGFPGLATLTGAVVD